MTKQRVLNFCGDDLDMEALVATLARKGLGKYERAFLGLKGATRKRIAKNFCTYLQLNPQISRAELERLAQDVLKIVYNGEPSDNAYRPRPKALMHTAPRKQANIH